MDKVDLKKQFSELYNVGAKARSPHLVDVPPLTYLMVDGSGNPETSQLYHSAMGALYSVSYGVKFAAKGEGRDFGVMPLEGLWWTDPPEAFSMDAKNEWQWMWPLILACQAICLAAPVAAYVAVSYLRTGESGLRSYERVGHET